MEAQLHRQAGHHYEDPVQSSVLHSVVEDEGDQQHEKKSVMMKVKAKAKKIKDTITKHGHGGHDEHEPEHQFHLGDDEEGDDEDEEVEEPEVHGPPGGVSSRAPASQGVNLEKPTAMEEDRYSPEVKGLKPGSGYVSGRPMASDEAYAPVPEGKSASSATDITGMRGLDFSGAHKEDERMQQQGVKLGEHERLERDTQAPNKDSPPVSSAPSNYEAKTPNPTGKGAGEADIEPLVKSLDKTSISDKSGDHGHSAPEAGTLPFQSGSTGSHDQFAPEPHTTPTSGDNPDSIPKSYDSSKPEDMPRDTVAGKASDSGSYIGRIAAVPDVIADKATAAKNVVASKLGYSGAGASKAEETGEGEGAAKSTSQPGYVQGVADKVTETLAPVYAKVADTGSSVVSRVKGAEGKEAKQETSGYSGAEAGKAEETGKTEGAAKSAPPTGYVQGMAAKVTGTLAPVYAKVADTGSSVISRVRGTESKEATPEITKEGATEVPDKGVSVTEYLSRTFEPGEEDKELSRKISDVLHLGKDNLVKTGETKSKGKVIDKTEGQSRILAEAKTGGDDNDIKVVTPEDVNKGVVSKVKETLSSWVGGAGQQEHSKEHVVDEGKKLDESGHAQTVSENKKVD